MAWACPRKRNLGRKGQSDLASLGVDPLGSSPEEFAATIAADIALWAEAVKIAGVQGK